MPDVTVERFRTKSCSNWARSTAVTPLKRNRISSNSANSSSYLQIVSSSVVRVIVVRSGGSTTGLGSASRFDILGEVRSTVRGKEAPSTRSVSASIHLTKRLVDVWTNISLILCVEAPVLLNLFIFDSWTFLFE